LFSIWKRQKKTPQQMVREFHEAYGMPVADKPRHISGERRALRWVLMDEELRETGVAMGDNDLEEIAKELADLLYVTYGTAVEYGINLDRAFELVHQSNMSKLGPDGEPIFREDGKVLKGPNYAPPDLREFRA
jgi:predicted HAD superfamily Cof-like phosphohydrolase